MYLGRSFAACRKRSFSLCDGAYARLSLGCPQGERQLLILAIALLRFIVVAQRSNTAPHEQCFSVGSQAKRLLETPLGGQNLSALQEISPLPHECGGGVSAAGVSGRTVLACTRKRAAGAKNLQRLFAGIARQAYHTATSESQLVGRVSLENSVANNTSACETGNGDVR